ncbi:PucR family transcriptional regulator [Nocardioides sp.]|uniref:PucR family transcriptional regulator n=1 Tax=Nocardioides sp. TaxID=35761 RepID=UPI003783D620
MSFTVGSLVADPLVRTRLVAGDSGLSREIAWAHTCEVEDPWNWLGSGDLLMTDGYSFPPEPAAQVEFIRELSSANIAGLALGEGFVAPPLTAEAKAAADELGFPILQTARSVPFVTISRVVAEASSSGQGNSRAARVLRLYDILRRNQRPGPDDQLLDLLGAELRLDLHVFDLTHGRDLLPGHGELPASLRRRALERAAEQGGQLSAFNRLADGDFSALLVPVGTRDSAALILRARTPDDAPDLVLAQHAAMIAELEVERRAARASRARTRGADLARRMLDGSIEPDAARTQLRLLGLGDGPWIVTAWAEVTPQGFAGSGASSKLVDALAFVPWPHLHTFVEDTHLIVLEHSRIDSGLDLDDLGVTMGASQPFSAMARFADAFREARWALESARQAGLATAVYGAHGSYFMPNTVAEGELAVRRLLGPVLDYDRANNAHLMESLQVYFEVNRSWQAGARRLGIHKQTLVYRLKKVEELTGADLRDFGVQAELYLALRTWRLLNPG